MRCWAPLVQRMISRGGPRGSHGCARDARRARRGETVETGPLRARRGGSRRARGTAASTRPALYTVRRELQRIPGRQVRAMWRSARTRTHTPRTTATHAHATRHGAGGDAVRPASLRSRDPLALPEQRTLCARYTARVQEQRPVVGAVEKVQGRQQQLVAARYGSPTPPHRLDV